jgi:hypothetical protein
MYITELNPHLLGGSAINSVYSGFLMIQCLRHAVPRPYPLQSREEEYIIIPESLADTSTGIEGSSFVLSCNTDY